MINEEVCFLQQYGIHFAMDDYGTGNASSSIVLGVPMNEIKLDMSFIKGILNNEKQQMLVKNIVNFARSTNMKSCIEISKEFRGNLVSGILLFQTGW